MNFRKPFTPRPYQIEMIDHVINTPRNALFADMGLGKTSSTLTALDNLFVSGYESKPALVLAPLRVAQSVWPDEAKKWCHLRNIEVQPILGTSKEREAALKKSASVYTTNYDNIPWLIEHLNGKWPFGTVIADEASRLKSLRISIRTSKTGKRFLSGQGGKRAKALAKIAYQNRGRWINLTGTPASNGVKDLWAPTWFLDFGQRLGNSFDAFSRRWFDQSYDGYSLVPKKHAQGEIENLIKDICLSLRAEDHFDLEKPIENFIQVQLPPSARKLYRQMEKEMFLQIGENEVEAFNAAAKTMKVLQLANGAIYVDDKQNYKEVHDAKIQALESILAEASGMPVLVAYNFKSDLDRLKRSFPKARILDHNPQTIRDWNAGKIAILLAHPASAGHGLNLADGGNILVFFSLNWNLEEHEQIIERLGPVRQAQAGYKRPMFIHYILAEDTIDGDVLSRLREKKSVQDALLNAMRRNRE
jgi:SNF2 family DNA or RNA helicase